MGKNWKLKRWIGIIVTFLVVVINLFLNLQEDYVKIGIGFSSLLITLWWMVSYFTAQDNALFDRKLIENLKEKLSDQEQENSKLELLIERKNVDNDEYYVKIKELVNEYVERLEVNTKQKMEEINILLERIKWLEDNIDNCK